MNNEPVVWTNAILGVIQSGIIALVALHVIELTNEQQTAILGFSTALITAINIIVVRSLVTPLANPKAADGTALVAEE